MTTHSARDAALDYLHAHNVVTLATHGPHGLWAAAVFYAADDSFNLTFLSAATTRHARNIAAEPRIAATIQEDYDAWPQIKGIQLEGDAALLEGAARTEAVAAYLARFPQVADDPQLKPALQKVNWYQLRPALLYFIDNSRGFGHRDTIIGSV